MPLAILRLCAEDVNNFRFWILDARYLIQEAVRIVETVNNERYMMLDS